MSVGFGLRNCLFAIALALLALPRASADVLFPPADENLISGATYTVTWDPVPGCPTVDLSIYQGGNFVCDVATGVPNDGTYEWTVDDCGLLPACNLRLRIGCGAAEVRSGRFGIDGRLLTSVIPGDRKVDLAWSRLDADTLGAARAAVGPDGLPRAFGGYSVWARTLDNQTSPALRERFTKIRLYDVRETIRDTVAGYWSFRRDFISIGPVERFDEDLDDFVTDDWVLAQSFTADVDREICRVRMFRGRTVSQWNATMIVVPLVGGLPDLTDTLGVTLVNGLGGTGAAGFQWSNFDFMPPVPISAGQSYALVMNGRPALLGAPETAFSWTHTVYDALEGGMAFSSSDGGAAWMTLEEADFAFVIAAGPPAGVCDFWIGQRRAGLRERRFTDPDSINALTIQTEGGSPQPVPVDGPFNGFNVEYAVTSFERTVLQSSGNIEFTSACEDTVRNPGEPIPDGLQPNRVAVWPELIIPESPVRTALPLLAEVYPVPNPYVRDVNSVSFPRWELPGENKIQFMNLPAEATIRIYTMAGDLVRVLRHADSDGSANWNLRNEADEIVTSGIYLWIVKTESGESRSGQLVLVL